MTTPNEELIAELQQLANEIEISYRIEVIEEAVKALQSQAERITELETEVLSWKICNDRTADAARDLSTQLSAIAATEPVAYRWVWKSKPHDIEGWCYTSTPPNSPELQEIEKLFTRPMPAQDVTELLEALEEYGRAGVGNSTDWRVQLSALRLATAALSKYKGAK